MSTTFYEKVGGLDRDMSFICTSSDNGYNKGSILYYHGDPYKVIQLFISFSDELDCIAICEKQKSDDKTIESIKKLIDGLSSVFRIDMSVAEREKLAIEVRPYFEKVLSIIDSKR
jgi:hypothetical protein